MSELWVDWSGSRASAAGTAGFVAALQVAGAALLQCARETVGFALACETRTDRLLIGRTAVCGDHRPHPPAPSLPHPRPKLAAAAVPRPRCERRPRALPADLLRETKPPASITRLQGDRGVEGRAAAIAAQRA
jgi:hypothetical protein